MTVERGSTRDNTENVRLRPVGITSEDLPFKMKTCLHKSSGITCIISIIRFWTNVFWRKNARAPEAR